MEACETRQPGLEIAVERDQHREPAAGACVAQPQPMLALIIGDDDVPAILGQSVGEQRRERRRIDGPGIAKADRRRVQRDGRGDQLGPPLDDVGEFSRWNGEKTTPSGARTRRARPPR